MNKALAKRILLLTAAISMLSGCSSVPVPVDTNPTGAEIKNEYTGTIVGTTPQQLYPGSYKFIKKGYVSKTFNVPQIHGSKAPPVMVDLERAELKTLLNSRPAGGDLFDQAGNLVGSLPISITRTIKGQTYDVRKFGFNSKSISINEESPEVIEVDLGSAIPGMILMKTVVGQNGIEIQSSLVFSEKDVIERSPNARAVRRLTDFPPTRWVGRFALYPDNKRLVVDMLDKEITSDAKESMFSNIWALDAGGGGGLQRLTDGKYLDEGPCFSDDGKFIYFGSSRAGKNAIFRMSTENTKGFGMVTPGTTADGLPQVSGDGSTLIWTAAMAGSDIPQLWSLPLKDGLPGGLPMQIREGREPRWSPNDDLILYTALDRNINKMKIWTMSPDGSKPTQITAGSNYNDLDAYWSADGSKIVFASDRGVANGKQNFDIWMMNADGSNPRQLTTNGSHDDRPIITPDGKTIYFRSNRGLKWDIWVMELVDEK